MKRLFDFIRKSKLQLHSDGKENGFEYVDLGLPFGTMWATCNVGADKIEDYGLLFQWGRTDGYRYDTKNQFRTEEENLRDTDNKYIQKSKSR